METEISAARRAMWLGKDFTLLFTNLKIRHGAIVDNVVAYVHTEFGDERL